VIMDTTIPVGNGMNHTVRGYAAGNILTIVYGFLEFGLTSRLP
jgi:hypothetical protein